MAIIWNCQLWIPLYWHCYFFNSVLCFLEPEFIWFFSIIDDFCCCTTHFIPVPDPHFDQLWMSSFGFMSFFTMVVISCLWHSVLIVISRTGNCCFLFFLFCDVTGYTWSLFLCKLSSSRESSSPTSPYIDPVQFIVLIIFLLL